ncbi:hypothetical protein L3073_07905 [Ancylomarina sp. DW003]|nr:PKD-like family lipoprotein [Ancylomarina sp. DW003]MDE5422129.1 hypothetical protein [Ancylomarina sp. DW003]
MKKIFNIGLLFILLAIAGCVNDETVHDLIELNDVEIKGFTEESYETILGEEFNLDPQISTLHNDESNLEYLWYYYERFGDFNSDTISREKILKHTFGNMVLGGNYNLTLKVTDVSSNVFYQKTVPFTAVNKFSKGTLFLCNESGETELNFLSKSNNFLYENVYASENGDVKLGDNPTKVLSIAPHDRNIAAHKAILVFNNNSLGGEYINPTSFEKIISLQEKVSGSFTPTMNIMHHCVSQGSDYLICNGKFHYRINGMAPEANWSSAMVLTSETPDYNLAPVSLHPGYASPLLFDNLNSRFMLCNSNEQLVLYTGSEHIMTAFDANDLGANMKMLCAGYLSDSDKMWALMNNSTTGKYWVLRFEVNDGVFEAKAKIEITAGMAPNLSSATKYESMSDIFVRNQYPWIVRSEGSGGKMMYLANNNVYVLDMNVDAGISAESELINGSAENVQITNVLAHPIYTPTKDDPNKQFTRLDICVKDLSLSGKQGGVIFYKLNELGGISAEEIYRQMGFCDEVIYVDEKQN